MSVRKPSICLRKRIISTKWRNKLLVQNINLTGHTKNVCCLRPLIFLETRVITAVRHWGFKVFWKIFYLHNFKAFCETGYNSILDNIIENKKSRWPFKFFFYPSCEKALNSRRVKSKRFRKSSFNFTLGQGSCLISDIARPNLNKYSCSWPLVSKSGSFRVRFS